MIKPSSPQSKKEEYQGPHEYSESFKTELLNKEQRLRKAAAELHDFY